VAELLPLALLMLAGGAAILFVQCGVLLTPETVAIRRARRRLGRQRDLVELMVERSVVRRALGELADVRRMLIIAGGTGDAGTWIRRTMRMALAMVAIIALGDAASVAAGNGMAIPMIVADPVVGIPLPVLPLAVAAVCVLSLLDVCRKVRTRQEDAALGLQDMLLLFSMLDVAPVRDARRIDPGDPLPSLARTLKEPALAEMLEHDAWRELVPTEPLSRPELFEALGQAYGVREFSKFGKILRTTTEVGGADAAEEYIAAVRALTEERIADARVKLSSRSITQLVPALGLLAALFVVILSAIVANSVQGGL
jgi:hypothetical protein